MEQDKYILIVDDDQLMGRAIARRIARVKDLFECPITRIEYPQAAVEDACTRPRPTFLLTDTEMPGMDGDELIRKMRLQLGDLLKHAVLMSGNPANRARAAEVGAEMFLLKPFTDEDWQALLGLLKDFVSAP